MKKWLYVKSILVLIAVVALLAGCAINQDNNSEEGVLVLGISDDVLRARTVVPDVTMEIGTYDVYFYGPNNPGPPSSPNFIVDQIPFGQSRGVPLKAGLWHVRVYADNTDLPPVRIAWGETETRILITRGTIINETITVRPFDGQGFLSVRVSWPENLLGANPVMEAQIVGAGDPANTPADSAIAITSSGATGGAEYQAGSKTLDDGYYLMYVSLKDTLGTIVWQTYEAARVLNGITTEAIYDLVSDINQGLVNIGIDPDLQNPLTIGFEQDGVALVDPEDDEIFETTLAQTDAPAVFEAIVTPTPDTYSWFWRGSLVTNGNTYTIDPSVEEVGIYWLDLAVQSDTIYSSARVVVTITE